jgi:predicted aconitase
MWLAAKDRDILSGARGEAAQLAMQLLVHVGEALGAERLIDISWAHVAAAFDNGQANHDFAERLAAGGARVSVPTTLTACSTDTRNSTDASALALIELYKGMGCEAELTCAPYQSRPEPEPGEQLGWCESSAVVYANSVLGARTNRYVEFLDMCAAVTGRVPETGLHIAGNRKAAVLCRLTDLPQEWLATDWFFQVLGIFLGRRLGDAIPAIEGLPASTSREQLRAFGASLGTTGSVNMFHAIGLTPEAATQEAAFQGQGPEEVFDVRADDLRGIAAGLTRNNGEPLQAVCLGAPHFSMDEFAKLHRLLDGRRITGDIYMIVATSRTVLAALEHAGLFAALQRVGVEIVVDRCTYYRPAIDGCDGHVMTNSAKWAYYAPAALGVPVTFADLQSCVDSACSGYLVTGTEPWAGR